MTGDTRISRRKPVSPLRCPRHIQYDVARVRIQQLRTEDVEVTMQTLKDCSNISIFPLQAFD